MVEADEAGGERPAVGGNEDSPDFGKIKGDSSTLVFFLILPWVLGFSEALGGDGGEDDNRQILSLPENGRHEVIGKAPNNEPEDDIVPNLQDLEPDPRGRDPKHPLDKGGERKEHVKDDNLHRVEPDFKNSKNQRASQSSNLSELTVDGMGDVFSVYLFWDQGLARR